MGMLALSEGAASSTSIRPAMRMLGPFSWSGYRVPFHHLSCRVRTCHCWGGTHTSCVSAARDVPRALSHTSPFFLSPGRWQQTSKSSSLSSSLQPAGAKADALREEMEEAANRVEICRVPPSLLPSTWKDGAGPWVSVFVHWRFIGSLIVSPGCIGIPKLTCWHLQRAQAEPRELGLSR